MEIGNGSSGKFSDEINESAYQAVLNCKHYVKIEAMFSEKKGCCLGVLLVLAVHFVGLRILNRVSFKIIRTMQVNN